MNEATCEVTQSCRFLSKSPRTRFLRMTRVGTDLLKVMRRESLPRASPSG